MSTKTVEQLREELRVAEERLHEELRKEKEAEQERKREEERKAYAELAAKVLRDKQGILAPILAALREKGVPAKLEGARIETDHRDTDVTAEVETTSSPSMLYSRRTTTVPGRYVLFVGEAYRSMPRVRYPQRGKGGHNVAKIVETILERRATCEAVAQREAEKKDRREKGAALAQRLNEELGTTLLSGSATRGYPHGPHGRTEYIEYPAELGHVYVNLGTRQYNEAQVRVLMAALAECDKLATKKGGV